jgi:hypothetical protein
MKSQFRFFAMTVLSVVLISGCSQSEPQDTTKAIKDLKNQVQTQQRSRLAGKPLTDIVITFIEISPTEVSAQIVGRSTASGYSDLSGSCTYELRSDEGRWVLKSATSESGGNTCAPQFTLP